MSTFEPLINLLVLLTVLSIAAERVTNAIKLRRPALRVAWPDRLGLTAQQKEQAPDEEKKREMAIVQRSLGVSIGLALLVKADMFAILGRLAAPWDTIGWVRMSGPELVRSAALAGVPSLLYAAGGCIITGIALGFGSKFWHDMLDTVFNARENLKNLAKK
jgi:hypothetical protein